MLIRSSKSASSDVSADASPLNVRLTSVSPSILCLIWGTTMLVGLTFLFDYQWRPAISGQPPTQWPTDCGIEVPTGRPVLLMFLHPHCPCSRASLSELVNAISHLRDEVDVHILFFASSDFAVQAERTDLWKQACCISRVKTELDMDGTTSRLFGANASGTTLIYGGDGHLRFFGGITAGRGHIGKNLGSSTMVSCLTSDSDAHIRPSVYGCPISLISNKCEGPDQ